jgi:sulfatase modifying factor 1
MRLLRLAAAAGAVLLSSGLECNAEDAAAEEQADDADPGQCACGNLGREHGEDGSASSSAKAAAEDGGDAARTPAAAQHNEEMVNIPGGRFYMGTPKHLVHFPQDGEGPVRQVKMTSFAIDQYEVSNAKFAEFVEAEDFVTEAEEFGDSFVAELWLSEAVSATIDNAVAAVPWWLPVKKCSWRQPEGFDTDIAERMDHPVIHVSWNDAQAYCKWRGGSLPTEAQWEYAARGGKDQKNFPWGNAMQPMRPKKEPKGEKIYRMNIWQGKFPTLNTADDGYNMTAPVDSFGEQNNYGLYNMVGNVWEWTSDWWTPAHYLTEENQHIGFVDPAGPTTDELDQLKEMGYMVRAALTHSLTS